MTIAGVTIPIWAIAAWLVVGGFVGFVVGDRRSQWLRGIILGVLLGPVGWLVEPRLPVMVRCRSCGKRTPWYPRPQVPPGASHPHLSCRRCGDWID